MQKEAKYFSHKTKTNENKIREAFGHTFVATFQ